jgi:predicted alpha/beta-hydrolase family hydrolase
VSALVLWPENAKACFIFAHDAGAGMTHAFMEAVATGLAERDIPTLRYQFPFMEMGRTVACAVAGPSGDLAFRCMRQASHRRNVRHIIS